MFGIVYGRELREHLDAFPRPDPLARLGLPSRSRLPAPISKRWPRASKSLLQGSAAALAKLPIDPGVGTTGLRGGARAARKAMSAFVDSRLDRYVEERNRPDVDPPGGGLRTRRVPFSRGSLRLRRDPIRATLVVHHHHVCSYLFRSMIAAAFAVNNTTKSTTIAAAVSDRNSAPGCRTQENTVTGSAVYGPVARSNKPAEPAEKKPVAAPTRSSGAVSPKARASVSTVPVRMPGAAEGST